MKKVKGISKYLKYGKTITNTVDMRVLVPKAYENSGLLNIDATVKVLGVFRVIMDEREEAHLVFLNIFDMSPSLIDNYEEDGEEYYQLHFTKGSNFINSRDIIKDTNKIAVIYNAFIALGKLPRFLEYDKVHLLFDRIKELCGADLGMNRSVYEIIYAHMHRDPDQLFSLYRNSNMKKTPFLVPLHKISHGPTSTTGRISGGYMTEGLVADLVTENTEASEVENLLRA